MNNKKANGYSKLLVFFVLAVILIFTVSLVADGWQEASAALTNDNSDKIADTDSDEVDENKTAENTDSDIPSEPEPEKPVYLNPLTGMETTDTLYAKRHGAFIFNSTAPLYGISSADILIEMPTEDGGTRFAALINDYRSLGKIGSIESTRGYISDIVSQFGAFSVSYGKDGRSSDPLSSGVSDIFDLSTRKGYHYTEYGDLIYTNGNLITGGIDSSGISTTATAITLPFRFSSGEERIRGSVTSASISLPISNRITTDLIYSHTEDKYTLVKNGTAKNDLLTNQVLAFDNCFILYMDSVTYDTKEGSELIMDTRSEGVGYYLTGGTVTDIVWRVSEDGDLSFFGSSGEILLVNPGTSYIACLKASGIGSTVFS